MEHTAFIHEGLLGLAVVRNCLVYIANTVVAVNVLRSAIISGSQMRRGVSPLTIRSLNTVWSLDCKLCIVIPHPIYLLLMITHYYG